MRRIHVFIGCLLIGIGVGMVLDSVLIVSILGSGVGFLLWGLIPDRPRGH